MQTVTLIDQPARRVAPAESSLDAIETKMSATTVPSFRKVPTIDEHPAPLIAALEEIEFRRAALERLLDDDLLWRCLV